MEKEKQLRDTATSEIEVRNVWFDQETDGSIEVWKGQQKAKGIILKKGEAVAELTKKGLAAEGIQ
jgi:hypothetical protein